MDASSKIIPTLPAVDIKRAKRFYQEKLGCTVNMEGPDPGAFLECAGGGLYIYQRAPSKADHTLATFLVDDVECEVRELRAKGVKFEEYDIPSMGLKTVNGIARMGDSKSAWFKDSEGNILGITQVAKVGRSTKHVVREKVGARR